MFGRLDLFALSSTEREHLDAGTRPPLIGGIVDVVFGGVAVGIARSEVLRRSNWARRFRSVCPYAGIAAAGTVSSL